MKKQFTKIISAVSAIVMAASAAGTLSVSAETVKLAGYRIGDLDGDKNVTLNDALGALIIYTDAITGGGAQASGANKPADIDNNGTVDLNDALSILQYYTGSLMGEERLWADIRPVTNVDVTTFHNSEGEPWTLNDMYLEIGCAAGAPGEEVTVPVYIAGAAQLAGFQYYQLIPEGFEITKIESPSFNEENGNFALNTDADFDVVFENEDGENYTRHYQAGAFIYVAEGGKNLDVSDGTVLVNVTYKIPEDAQPGSFHPLSAMDAMFITHDLEAYNYTMIDGIILVK